MIFLPIRIRLLNLIECNRVLWVYLEFFTCDLFCLAVSDNISDAPITSLTGWILSAGLVQDSTVCRFNPSTEFYEKSYISCNSAVIMIICYYDH